MRVSKGLGFAGISAAMGAVALIPASASAGTTYNSTATATAGSVSIAGNNVPVPNNSVTATNQTGPQEASLGVSALESALGGSAGPLVSSMKATLPTGADLLTETATAAANGKSTACAGFLLAGDCTATGKAQPLTLSLSLADLPGLPTGAPSDGTNQSQTTPQKQSPRLLPTSLPTSLPTALPKLGGSSKSSASSSSSSASNSSAAKNSSSTPNPLAAFAIVLTLSGPEATCTAGPPGSAGSNFTATQSLASASVDIQQNGKSLLPGGPIALKSGDILNQLPSSLPAPLTSALSQLNISSLTQANPVDLTIDPGSTSGVGSGPSTTATAGELGLSVSGTQLLDLKAAQAKCGPNKAAVATSATKPAKKTSSETPLGGGIQTDEGRSGSGSDPVLWAGVAGAAVLGGTASGLTLWRRRRNAL